MLLELKSKHSTVPVTGEEWSGGRVGPFPKGDVKISLVKVSRCLEKHRGVNLSVYYTL